MPTNMEIIILGLSITSSWGNGHATTYRHLVRGLAERGHRLTFLERDTPWYSANRDLQDLAHGELRLYQTLEELFETYATLVSRADLVIVGSYVPEGIAVGDWAIDVAAGVVAFYDIDTPVTLRKMEEGQCEYVAPRQLANYDLYLSFTGGPTLAHLEQLGAPCARPLYCSVDPNRYHPQSCPIAFDLRYMGTYSPDRQPGVEELLIAPARDWQEGRFILAGSQFPQQIDWPINNRTSRTPSAQRACLLLQSPAFHVEFDA